MTNTGKSRDMYRQIHWNSPENTSVWRMTLTVLTWDEHVIYWGEVRTQTARWLSNSYTAISSLNQLIVTNQLRAGKPLGVLSLSNLLETTDWYWCKQPQLQLWTGEKKPPSLSESWLRFRDGLRKWQDHTDISDSEEQQQRNSHSQVGSQNLSDQAKKSVRPLLELKMWFVTTLIVGERMLK